MQLLEIIFSMEAYIRDMGRGIAFPHKISARQGLSTRKQLLHDVASL